MFKRILVPLDGSARAERALSVAARMARSSEGTIILIQAMNVSAIYGPALVPYSTVTPEMLENEQENAKSYLAQVAASPLLAGIATETFVDQGEAASVILAAAESYTADVIVLCSHGRSGFARWALGSVAEKIIHHAAIPVLVLREKGPMPAGPHPDPTMPLRVLVPLDGSVLAKAALEPAAMLIAALATPARGELHLIRIVPSKGRGAADYDLASQHARVYLEQTTEHLREGVTAPAVARLHVPITWSVVMADDVASALIGAAESGEEGSAISTRSDLIAMATHGRQGFQRWTMGSVTERVLHATRLPLLIVRPAAMQSKQKKQEATEKVASLERP
ncbi:MAG: universal stress protein [Ktedonobacteraceae bacterium]|nr:universal stress protein [Ktedonobacteraceae bacterium]